MNLTGVQDIADDMENVDCVILATDHDVYKSLDIFKRPVLFIDTRKMLN